MILLQPFHYRPLERITREDGVRHYVCPDSGALLPSVTTILSATADQTGLLEWRKWIGEARAEEVRNEATGLGSLMHDHLECHVKGSPRPRGNNLVRVMARNMADRIIEQCLPAVDECWGTEVALFLPETYAGTTDLIGVYQGKPAIMDYKTAKKMRSKAMISDYFLQGVAYAEANNFHFGTTIETVVVFMVARDLTVQTFCVEGDAYRACRRQWHDRIAAYRLLDSKAS